MEISAAIAATHGLTFLPRPHSTVLSIAASGTLPVDSIAPPTIVRSDPYRTVPRSLTRRRRRTRRRSLTDDGGEDAFSGDGDGDDGPFGGGGDGGGGGRWWNPDGFGDADWEGDDPRRSSSDPAFDFVYEVLSWAALSNCAHFAYKKIGRFLTDREKAVPAIC